MAISRVDPVEHAREGDRLAQVLDAADPGHDPLDAHAEARMGHAAVRAKIAIPAERLFGEVVLANALVELLSIREALAAPDDLAISLGGQDVRGERKLRTLRIRRHVERLDRS